MKTLQPPASLFLFLLLAWTTAPLADDFPKPYNTEPPGAQPMPADQAAAAFRVPPGFHVSVFASEPDVQNPIAMAWDPRGRLWVAENYTYAERPRKFDLALRDRVLIFEDRDGDGRFDRRTEFTDVPQRLISLELGLGGVWLMCPPQLLFIPDRNGDDAPDGPAEVALDGFNVPPENYHTIANGLHWGPDGWLYGRCGASSIGRVGPPGAPAAQRIPINGGLWRYQPGRKTFEVLAHGTTNPWGHDWNDLGEAFFVNTVNGHLWHAVAGMHFNRGHTINPNARVYVPIDMHADHWHWDNSKDWTDSRSATGEHDRRGGGHAHCGAMIYLGGQWPAAYRDKLFTLNLHGRRVNIDRLERSGCGYVGRHEEDAFFAGDSWFRGLELGYGPDGSVFVLDWSDTGECHEATGVHRTSGRIYRITYLTPQHAGSGTIDDLARRDERALVELLEHPNEWYGRQARGVLATRAAAGQRLDTARAVLLDRVQRPGNPAHVLRALWALNAIGGADRTLLEGLADHEHEAVRAWSIRLLTDALPLDTILSQRGGPEPEAPVDRGLLALLVRHARADRSGLVRLVLASTLQRLPIAHRAELAAPLLAHAEDAADHDAPLLAWYGLIPLGDTDPSTLERLAETCALPTTRRLIARRLAESIEANPEAVAHLVACVAASESASAPFQADILGGLADGLRGRRKAPRPAGWDALVSRLDANPSTDRAVRDRVRELSVVFGDGRALDEVRRLALDEKAELDVRRTALLSLIESRPADLRSVCERLLKVRFLNATAVRGLELYNDPEIGRSLAASYRSFHPSERGAVLDALVSRPTFARALLDAIAAGKVPAADLTAFHARQVRSLDDAELDRRLAEVWGALRDSGPEKRALMARLKQQLSPAVIAAADPGRGRAVFNKTCASCHMLYGHGGQVGPDLTGAGRDNLDYLLENIVDPSATVTADFRMVVVAMTDGRVLNGIVKARNERTLTLQTQNELLVLDRSDIEGLKPTPASLMPEGQLEALGAGEVRDLFAYLMSRVQAPLPGETASDSTGSR
jgi:putative membrane-bound dehydrogenase-like protein